VLILPEQVLHRTESLVAIKRRPFSLCILIDAPLMMRYKRSVEGLGGVVAQLTLEQFVEQSDLSLFNDRRMPTSLLADMIIINDFLNQSALHDHIDSITPSITDKTRLRPEWDDYFMLLADLAAHRSNCMKRRVGCIIVRDCRVIASGYNGTARGIRNCNEGGCGRCNKGEARCGQGLAECLCLHAEENALLEIGRLGGNGASLYCNTW
jgi:dCMP deaminase